jgi:hypothetical protein
VPSDSVRISDAARALADADAAGQWQAAIANRRTGIPQLVRVDTAFAGGVGDLQGRLRHLLSERGLDPNTTFNLSYDAATQSFHIDGEPAVRTALEAELNAASPTANATAIREGHALLEDIDSSLAAVRAQYARDRVAEAGDTVSGRDGVAYRLVLGMSAGMLSAERYGPYRQG